MTDILTASYPCDACALVIRKSRGDSAGISAVQISATLPSPLTGSSTSIRFRLWRRRSLSIVMKAS